MTKNPIKRLFLPEFFLKDSEKLGEIPSNKEVYEKTLDVAIPAVTENFLISFMSMLDTIMVSSLGAGAVAAVNVSTQPRFIALALIFALNMGVTSIIAHRRGQDDSYGANTVLKQSLIISSIISIISAIAFYFLSVPMLSFAGAGPDIIKEADTYFKILMLGLPFSALSLTISAAQQGAGFTRISMIINISSNLGNLIINYLLINGNLGFPALGVKGAAIGTSLGYVLGFIFAIISVMSPGSFINIRGKDGWKFDKKTLKPLYTVVSGSFVEQIGMRIGFLLYNKTVASLGTIPFATHSLVMQIANLAFSFGQGLSMSSNTMVGQGLGAKRPDLSSLYSKACQRVSFVLCTVMIIVFIFGGVPLMSLLTKDENMIKDGAQILTILGIILYFQASQMIYMGSLRGAGDTKYTAIVVLICIMILRPGLAYIFAYPVGWGLIGIWMGFVFEQIIRLTLTFVRFHSGKWKHATL